MAGNHTRRAMTLALGALAPLSLFSGCAPAASPSDPTIPNPSVDAPASPSATQAPSTPTPSETPEGPRPTPAVAAVDFGLGWGHWCVAYADGTIECWGANRDGLLGHEGPDTLSDSRGRVPGIAEALDVEAGIDHSCALRQDGTVWCWGADSWGVLGTGTWSDDQFGGSDSPNPVQVIGLDHVAALSAGYLHNCAVLADASLRCWGFNGEGILGDGTILTRTTPVPIPGMTDIVAVAAGYHFTCALKGSGSVWCWGSNGMGQVGDGTISDTRAVPAEVVGVAGAVAIATGDFHACALLDDGTIKCWGHGEFGQLGAGSTAEAVHPVDVASISDAIAITAGGIHTCALHADGTVSCWGSGFRGQFGSGHPTNETIPVTLVGVADVVAIDATYDSTCFIFGDGNFECRGEGALTSWGSGT